MKYIGSSNWYFLLRGFQGSVVWETMRSRQVYDSGIKERLGFRIVK